MISVNIDGKEIRAAAGQTILEIARQNNIEIPTLCHDERVKPYGSCGLCVVEVEGSKNLVRSCAIEALDGMRIHSDTARIRRSRKLTLEMLLSDHQGDCRPPCLKACPAGTDCQGYVGLIANGQFRESVALLKEHIPIPASIGLVCPHPCEDACRRKLMEEPISIAALKAFVACQDLDSQEPYMPGMKPSSGKKVAVVGAGPAGLTAAFYLAREGHKITIYDAMPRAGGMLRYGIPQYRLPKGLLDLEINLIERMGVEFVFNTKLGTDILLEDIRRDFDAVFLGIGAWVSSKIGCAGEDSTGVLGGIDFLRDVAMRRPVIMGARVAVIGGGNTAMDAARTAVRLGAEEVMVLYRRTRAEMPAEDIEIKEAEEEGVIFHFLVAPEEIIEEDGRLAAIRLQKMELGEADSSGRRRPVPTGEEQIIPLDTIIAAIGQQVNTTGLEGIKLSRWGTIDAHAQTGMTSMDGVFAGGDGVSGPGIAIEAIAQGRAAAEAIKCYLAGEKVTCSVPFWVEREVTAAEFSTLKQEPRILLHHTDPLKRCRSFEMVSRVYTVEEAVREASRCLECGCADYFECKLIKYGRDYAVEPQRLAGEIHKVIAGKSHPYIVWDMDKCILCGLCARVCDEVMGVTALGLVDRGFDTHIQPELGGSLQNSACICCGQCINLCPTGALTERNTISKNVPLVLRETHSFCSQCSLACGQIIKSHGDKVAKVVPEAGEILCYRGRFGWEGYESERLSQPMLKKNGKHEEISWEEAYQFLNQSVEKVRNAYGSSAMAVYINPSASMEEAEAAAALAHNIFGTAKMGSFSPQYGRKLAGELGVKVAGIDSLDKADLIIMLGSLAKSQVAAVEARKAVEAGAKLVIISRESTLADDKALIKLTPQDNNVQLLEQFMMAVNRDKALADNSNGVCNEEPISITPDMLALTELYRSARQPVLLIDGYTVSNAAAEIMIRLAAIPDDVKSPIITFACPGGNAAGIWQAGFRRSSEELLGELESGQVQALFIVGEDPLGAEIMSEASLKPTQLSVVLTPYMTPTAVAADLILPVSVPLEVNGSYLSFDGSRKNLTAVRPAAGQDTLSVLRDLSRIINPNTARIEDHPVSNENKEPMPMMVKIPIFFEYKESDFAVRKLQDKMEGNGLI